MQQLAWQMEFLRIFVTIALGLALGWSTGYPTWGLIAGLCVSLIMIFRAMTALYRWTHGQGMAPQDGLIGFSVDRLIRREKKLLSKIADQAAQLRRYRQGIESLHDGVVILTGDEGYITTFNSAAARLLGLRRESDQGQIITHLIRDHHFKRYLKDGNYSEPIQFDIRHRKEFSLQVQVTEYGSDQKVMLVKDITERKRVEVMRQNFIADVSHELRTPLTVINGYLEMLTDVDLPPAFERALAQMDDQSKRMQALVNDLIQLSKLESDTSNSLGDWFNVKALAETVVDQLQAISNGRIQFRCFKTIEILGQTDEMNSILTNLLSNAIKYGGEGPITFTIAPFLDGVKVSINDQGPGIPARHLSRLTERFYRVDESRESKIGGSGLGLAIVKHALERLDTTLDIESVLGKGSTFSFTIPGDRCRIS